MRCRGICIIYKVEKLKSGAGRDGIFIFNDFGWIP